MLIGKCKRWHPYVQPWPDRDRTFEERVKPVGLHLGTFRRQQRRRQRGIGHECPIIAAIVLNLVASNAIPSAHQRTTEAQRILAS